MRKIFERHMLTGILDTTMASNMDWMEREIRRQGRLGFRVQLVRTRPGFGFLAYSDGYYRHVPKYQHGNIEATVQWVEEVLA